MGWSGLRRAVYHGLGPGLPVFGGVVPFVFLCHGGVMTNDLRVVEKDDLLFDVERALDKAACLLPRKRRPGEHNPYRMAAREVVEHLELCGLRFFRGPSGRWQGRKAAVDGVGED